MLDSLKKRVGVPERWLLIGLFFWLVLFPLLGPFILFPAGTVYGHYLKWVEGLFP